MASSAPARTGFVMACKGLEIPRRLAYVPVRVRPSAFIFNNLAHLKLFFLPIVFLFFPDFFLFLGHKNVTGRLGVFLMIAIGSKDG